jgi:hypothetical protein
LPAIIECGRTMETVPLLANYRAIKRKTAIRSDSGCDADFTERPGRMPRIDQ